MTLKVGQFWPGWYWALLRNCEEDALVDGCGDCGCRGTLPTSVTATIPSCSSGLYCDSAFCGSIAGQYVLTRVGKTCEWEYQFSMSDTCEWREISLFVSGKSTCKTSFQLSVYHYCGQIGYLRWEKELTERLDCDDPSIDGLSLPNKTPTSLCCSEANTNATIDTF